MGSSVGSGQRFSVPIEGGKLKTWESEKLTDHLPRISGFQIFTHHRHPRNPTECVQTGSDLNGSFMLNTGLLVTAGSTWRTGKYFTLTFRL